MSTAAGAAVLSVLLAGAVAGCAPPPEQASEPALAPFLIDQDFADPDVVAVDGEYFAFATNTRGVHVQVASSVDLEEWDVSLTDALPRLPSWASEGRTWAPDVSALPGGGYVMYFVAAHTDSDRQCIGGATASEVTGPYTAFDGDPVVCTLDEGGSIDPAVFTEVDGGRYLLWKNDGNCCAMETWLQIAPLTDDGSALAAPSTKLITQTEEWEGQLVEAPTLITHDDEYVLFYSANDYGTDEYAIGMATASDLSGPYVKAPEPFLTSASSDGAFIGPGGQDVVSTPDGDVLVFHGWDELLIYRGMYSAPLEWAGDQPSVTLP